MKSLSVACTLNIHFINCAKYYLYRAYEVLVHSGVFSSIIFSGTHLYKCLERGTVKVNCFPKFPNLEASARAQIKWESSRLLTGNHYTSLSSTITYMYLSLLFSFSLHSSLFHFLLAGESESQGEVAQTHGARAKRWTGGRGWGEEFPFLPCPFPLSLIFCYPCPSALARLPLAWKETERTATQANKALRA